MIALTFRRRWSPAFVQVIGQIPPIIVAGGICTMVYLTNGSLSEYYEGANLVILATLIINGYFPAVNVISGLVIILEYEIAVLANPLPIDQMHFIYANYFLWSTYVFVIISTFIFSRQHRRTYLQSEELKVSQEKLQLLNSIIEAKSKVDDLTKLYNRGHFLELLRQKIVVSREQKKSFYLIIFDVDNFKQVNDIHGHLMGDQVIKEVAQTVLKKSRADSFIGRYGGDEFLFTFDDVPTEVLISRVGQMCSAVSALVFHSDAKGDFSVSASFGAAKFDPNQNKDEKALIELADQALLEVKRTGKGKVQIYS